MDSASPIESLTTACRFPTLPGVTMTFEAALQALAGFQRFGLRPGLDTTRTLAARAGNPESRLRFIHVAGTNGKGSTCAMLESVYRAAGYRTGLYTSPHLVRFGERIQVQREPMSDAAVAALVEEALPWTAGLEVTFFEFVTVLALVHFVRSGCEIVIWETGLGGRWDATNIVTPLASVITNIGLDHQQWLGETLPLIAAEKAGIMKPGVPAITGAGLVPGAQTPGSPEAAALEVLRSRAAEVGAPFVAVDDAESELKRAGDPAIALLGSHQRANAAVALATVRTLQGQLPVKTAAIHAGLSTVRWPGRLQVIRRGEQTLLLDGAHNRPGVETLVAALERHFPGRRPALILGILADKDWSEMAARLAPVADRIIVAPVGSSRTVDPGPLAEACCRANAWARVECVESVAEALGLVVAEPFVVGTGSLYFIGEILERLRVEAGSGGWEEGGMAGPMATTGERSLNEWRRTD